MASVCYLEGYLVTAEGALLHPANQKPSTFNFRYRVVQYCLEKIDIYIMSEYEYITLLSPFVAPGLAVAWQLAYLI